MNFRIKIYGFQYIKLTLTLTLTLTLNNSLKFMLVSILNLPKC